MRSFKVVNGELVFEAGALVTVSGKEAIAQAIECALKTFRGEWFLDTSIGVPYLDGILGAKPLSLDVARSVIRREILGVPGVTGLPVLDLQREKATRTLVGSFRAETDEGLVEGVI